MSITRLRTRQTITHTTQMTSSDYDCGITKTPKIFRASAFAVSSDFSRASFSASRLVGSRRKRYQTLSTKELRDLSALCRLLGNAVSQSRIHQTKSIDSQDEHNLRIESACWDAGQRWKICLTRFPVHTDA